MAVVFDTNTLLVLLDPNVPAPPDPDTGLAVTQLALRLNHLVANLQQARQKILVPTPVLAELVWLADSAGPGYVTRLNKYGGAFQIVDFDQAAAIELALMTAADSKVGGIRAGSTESMAKIKFDRQIVAIAKTKKVSKIYANDRGLISFARKCGIDAVKLNELPLPPEEEQTTIQFPEIHPDAVPPA